ncbi:T9SS type A sorting domain-containing protein [uncultured Psychroserpens sp.]|uniref:T9SS type A sorting domain-containing protein n=1 Tax=uncultured Psychroserpens sp. TaxID=255436 RepID=UPI002628494B|nr:T9SS type A sorting domain-containing protein [uncultured Psychroserpens sp.]
MKKIALLFFCFFTFFISQASNSCSLYTGTELKADLRYIDVSLTSGLNQVFAINGHSFSTDDVGKLIAIRKGHHNPYNGVDVPFTTPGRIVTITAGITSVATDGSYATINFTPNQTVSNTKAYVYTNNFELLQTLMHSGATTIDLPQDGIIGVNPFYNAVGPVANTAIKALMFPQTNALSIQNTGNARIKLCAETIDWDIEFALFGTAVSNHDITVNISCIPPDEATTCWGGRCSFFSTKLISDDIGTGSSLRTIRLLNTIANATDLNSNTDSFWNFYFDGLNGGLEDNVNFQEIIIENSDEAAEIRTRNGGIYQFGGGSQMHITNLKVNYSGHYLGENGRDFIANEGLNEIDYIYNETFGGQWQFENFEIDNGILKPIANTDFSWYDYVAPSRTMGVSIDGVTFYQFDLDDPLRPGITDILNGHELDISNASLPNGVYTITIQFHNDFDDLVLPIPRPHDDPPFDPYVRTYGHPNYVHPDVAFRLDNVTSEFGHWRYYATGDQYDGIDASIVPVFSEIYNSNIQGTGLQFQNFGDGSDNREIANVTRGTLKIFNSDVKARLIFGSLELTDTEIDGDFIYVNSLVSHGGNRLEFQTVDVYHSNFISVNDFYDGYLVRFLKEDVLVKLDSTTFGTNYGQEHLFPYVPNGTLQYINNLDPNNRLPRYDNSITSIYANEFTEESTVIFENCEFEHVDGNSFFYNSFNNGVLRNGAKIEFRNFKFRNATGFGKLIRPYFAPDHKNNGMADIPIGDELLTYKLNKTSDLPYCLDGSDLNAIGARISFSNKHTLANKFVSIIVPTFTTNDFGQFFFTTDWANGAYVNDEFTLRITDDFVRFNPYYTSGNTNNKRGNTSLSNLVLNTSGKRQNGEIIRFKVDSKQNRVIEIVATLDGNPINKYYIDSDPTGTLGLDGEILYLEGDDSVFWTHQVLHNNITGNTYSVNPQIVDGHTEIDTDIYFSIKQELRSQAPWEDFEFKLKDTHGNEFTFINSSADFFRPTAITGASTDVHPEYLKHFWAFESRSPEHGSILCYIENRTGRIIFKDVLPFNLAAVNALTINNGWEVTEHLWIPGPNNPRDCSVDIYGNFDTSDTDFADGNPCTALPFGHFNPAWNTPFPWKATEYYAAYHTLLTENFWGINGCSEIVNQGTGTNVWMLGSSNPIDTSPAGNESVIAFWVKRKHYESVYNGVFTDLNDLEIGKQYRLSFYDSPVSTPGGRQTPNLYYKTKVKVEDASGEQEWDGPNAHYYNFNSTAPNIWYEREMIFTATSESMKLTLEFPLYPDPNNIVNDGYVAIDEIKVTCLDNMAGRQPVVSIDRETIENSISDEIKLYPNPTKGWLTVDLSNTKEVIDLVTVYNLQGAKVKSEKPTSSNTIDISDLQSGMYFVKIETSTGKSNTQKIIKL